MIDDANRRREGETKQEWQERMKRNSANRGAHAHGAWLSTRDADRNIRGGEGSYAAFFEKFG